MLPFLGDGTVDITGSAHEKMDDVTSPILQSPLPSNTYPRFFYINNMAINWASISFFGDIEPLQWEFRVESIPPR